MGSQCPLEPRQYLLVLCLWLATRTAQTCLSRQKVALQCGSTEAAIRGAHQNGLFTTADVLHLADFLALTAALQAPRRLSAGSYRPRHDDQIANGVLNDLVFLVQRVATHLDHALRRAGF